MGGKPSDEVLLVVALVNLTILVFGFVGSAIYFLPSMYVMAVKAARNKQVDSSDLEIDSGYDYRSWVTSCFRMLCFYHCRW